MRLWDYEKFHCLTTNLGDSVAIWRLHGGRCWIFRGGPWMPPWPQNDEDVQLLRGKGIKRHLVMSSTDFKSRDLYSVLMWELLGANRCEKLVIFLQISVAIDLHEESTFIPHGIFTNSITQPFRFVLYYIYSRFMGSSCVKITYFVGHSRHFYHAVRLMVRWATIAKKLKN